nr:GTP-binding protein [uncultured Acetatifactor sp.]
MKILVISGFLGAGKTTFIKELVKRTKQDFAIMENEYGALNVDGDILGNYDDSLNVWEMTEGCICCTRKADFASSVLTIANTLDPAYLIVEPTGVGALSKIINNIRKIQYERISLLPPITILDGKNFSETMEKHHDLCMDQLEAAGTVVISKRESADPEELASLMEKIQKISPKADICTRHYTKMDDAWWQSLLKAPSSSAPGEHSQKENYPEIQEEMESLALTSISLENENQLLLFLQGVTCGVFGDICRGKGYLKAGDAWLQFDVVNHTYSVTGFDPSESSKAIFIGSGIKRNLLREVLQKHMYTKPGEFFPYKKIARPSKNSRQKIGK